MQARRPRHAPSGELSVENAVNSERAKRRHVVYSGLNPSPPGLRSKRRAVALHTIFRVITIFRLTDDVGYPKESDLPRSDVRGPIGLI